MRGHQVSVKHWGADTRVCVGEGRGGKRELQQTHAEKKMLSLEEEPGKAPELNSAQTLDLA